MHSARYHVRTAEPRRRRRSCDLQGSRRGHGAASVHLRGPRSPGQRYACECVNLRLTDGTARHGWVDEKRVATCAPAKPIIFPRGEAVCLAKNNAFEDVFHSLALPIWPPTVSSQLAR